MKTNIDDIVKNSLTCMEMDDLDKIIDNASEEVFNDLIESTKDMTYLCKSSYLVLNDKIICPWCGGNMIAHSHQGDSWHYECEKNCIESQIEKGSLLKFLQSKAWVKWHFSVNNCVLLREAKRVSKPFFLKEITRVIKDQYKLKRQFQNIE
jgi:hypothetical protein